MFARGGAVQRFQAGGPAMPMQDNPTVAAALPTMGMAETGQLQQMPMEGVMGMAQQAGIDPAQLEQLLGQMAGQFGNLDEAEDFEQVMNALRGDQAPIAARREELANLVGPEDANATPESVLTLVQPVMMMAAVDQGIGGLAAEEMSTPVEGPMAEGIMSMAMPQGAPPPAMPQGAPPMPQGAPPMPGMEGPAPVNFRFGGPVVAMQEGGEPGNRLQELYNQQREVYRGILNPADQAEELEQQRRFAQSQMLLDLAGTALAFAGPGSRSGMSPAERLAEAAQQTQLFDRLSQRTTDFDTARQAQAKEGRALDLAALQSAGTLQAAEVEASLRPRPEEANIKGVPMSVYNRLPQAAQDQILGLSPEAVAELQIFVDSTNPENIVILDLSTPEGKRSAAGLGPNFLPVNTPDLSDITSGRVESPLGSSFNAKFLSLISDPERMVAYGSGELDVTNPEEARILTNALTLATQARPIWDQTLGREVMVPAMTLSQQVLDVIAAREALGLPVPRLGANVGGPQTGAPVGAPPKRVRFNDDGTINFSSFEGDPTFLITGVDLTQSQDWRSTVNRFFNIVAGQLQPILGGSGYAGEGGQITSVADTQLTRLATQIMRVARADTDGKIFVLDATLLGEEVNKFRPGGAKTDNQARDALVTTRNSLASMWNDTHIILMSPANYDQGTIVSARTLQAQVERLLAETTAAVSIYDRFISGDPLGDAAADRAVITNSITSTLPRATGQ